MKYPTGFTFDRIMGKYRRLVSAACARRPVGLRASVPIVCFSFDDAPRSAFRRGAEIVCAHGGRATFYVSLGKLGRPSPSGAIGSLDDLGRAAEEGHEIGCHTFDHRDPWKTPPGIFEQSVLRNRRALAELLPQLAFTTFAYPLCGPGPRTKRRIGKLFKCCRGGGQTFNAGRADLNLLKAYFIDHRNRNDFESIKNMIDRNRQQRGWLIFATHDVADDPSPYGAETGFFEKTAACAAESGAAILTVRDAFEQLTETPHE
jgi:peptidoglycan/xylan/chitin deacetylase (PgdA/CDA1 family)